MSCSDTSNDAVVESSVAIAKFVLNIDCGMLTLDLGYPWIDEHIRIIIYLPNGFLLQVPHAKAKLWISMWCSFQFDYWNEMFVRQFRHVSNLSLILFLFTMNDLFTMICLLYMLEMVVRKISLITPPTPSIPVPSIIIHFYGWPNGFHLKDENKSMWNRLLKKEEEESSSCTKQSHRGRRW